MTESGVGSNGADGTQQNGKILAMAVLAGQAGLGDGDLSRALFFAAHRRYVPP
jgi:hypothetical protein